MNRSSGAKPSCLICGLAAMFMVAVKNDISEGELPENQWNFQKI